MIKAQELAIEPRTVFERFAQISAIPRGSGNEKQVSDFLVQFARERGLWVYQDEFHNVIIRKPGSAGYENAPTVIIQGHIDMVCEKNRDVEHDFITEGIKLVVDGDYLTADGTTLGADNGIAVAMGLALLDEDGHPPLELLFTADEEAGMTGAGNLDPAQLTGRILLNLDSDEEGVFLASCAGGMRVEIRVPIEYTQPSGDYISCALAVNKLRGGHSGSDIHKELANSNRVLSRALCKLGEFDYYITDIWGGAKENAIPREAEATLAVKADEFDRLAAAVAGLEAVLKTEYRESDPDISLTLTRVPGTVGQAFTKACGKKVAAAGSLMPNGVQHMCMSEKLAGIVETSLNLGVVSVREGCVVLRSALRSSVASRKWEMADRLRLVAEALGVEFEVSGEYPSWAFDPDSKIQSFFMEQYKAYTGKDAVLTAIHAGLECGLFAEKLNMPDMISMGPNTYGAHTPDERVSISSVARMWGFLKFALSNMK